MQRSSSSGFSLTAVRCQATTAMNPPGRGQLSIWGECTCPRIHRISAQSALCGGSRDIGVEGDGVGHAEHVIRAWGVAQHRRAHDY